MEGQIKRRKTGLVVEGGGMKCAYSAGILDGFLDGKIAFDSDGLPVTTKGDRAFHGFGIRSMKQIAEKYKGTLSVSTSDHTFTLNILIPCR